MNKTYAYHWETRMKYPIYYEERGDKLVLKWSGMPRAVWAYVKDEVKGLEGARWHPDDKCWTADHPRVSLRNRHALGYLTDGEMPGTDKEWVTVYSTPVDPKFEELVDQIPVDFRPYQREDLPIILQRRRMELGYDMGLGKTLMGLSVIHIAQQMLTFDENSDVSQDPNDLYWVIGPKNPLDAWRSELVKWQFGSAPQLIVNSPQSIYKAMDNAPHAPMVLIIDESANFKTPSSQRSGLVFELARLMRDFWDGNEYILNLTGTPAPKDPSDWWMQIEILCPGFLREKSPAKLRERLAVTKEIEVPHGTVKKVVGWRTDEIQKLSKRLKPICIIRLKKDVESQLPDKIYIEREANLDPSILATARIIVESETGAQRMNALRQLSDGFQYRHEEKVAADGFAKRTRTGADHIHCPKDDMLLADLEELKTNEKDRVIVWAGFQAAVDKITQLCLKAGWDVLQVDGRGRRHFSTEDTIAPRTVDNVQDFFQNDHPSGSSKPLALVGNPGAGGEGLTLTRSDTMIFYSNNYRADKRQQAEDRFHRIGMDENISPRVIDYIHLPTDRLVTKNLKQKKDLQALSRGEILDAFDMMEAQGK